MLRFAFPGWTQTDTHMIEHILIYIFRWIRKIVLWSKLVDKCVKKCVLIQCKWPCHSQKALSLLRALSAAPDSSFPIAFDTQGSHQYWASEAVTTHSPELPDMTRYRASASYYHPNFAPCCLAQTFSHLIASHPFPQTLPQVPGTLSVIIVISTIIVSILI